MKTDVFLKTIFILIAAILGFLFVFLRQQQNQAGLLVMRLFPLFIAIYMIGEALLSLFFSKEQKPNYNVTRIIRMVLGCSMFMLHLIILIRF